jgi:23S rRNA pseudouridine1911/1915/1917 synthase
VTPTVAFTASDDDAGRRRDAILARRLRCSRAECHALIEEGRALVGGAIAKPSRVLRKGEHVTVVVPTAPARDSAPQPEALPLHIVYQDDDLCVVDKPAGMATHPAPGAEHGTLVNALLGAVGPLPASDDPRRPGIVHRLDRDTSGLIVVAKSERALRALQAAIRRRKIERRYHAVVWGAMPAPHGKIEAPIGRDPDVPTRFAIRDDGRPAVTHYRVLETNSGTRSVIAFSLLELTLETGRTHQIRVHCAALGHPVVGDRVYGGRRRSPGIDRQALHAVGLRFDHPITGAPLNFESPWPPDFAALMDRLRAEERDL